MYLKKIEIENIGPIDTKLEINLPFFKDGNEKQTLPKPLIIVGKNGSGKSILLSYIIDNLLNFKRQCYEKLEIDKIQLYKFRSRTYINSNHNFGWCSSCYTHIDDELFSTEVLSNLSIEDFKQACDYSSIPLFDLNNEEFTDNGLFLNFNNNPKKIKEAIDNSVILYFPANRFENPAWFNDNSIVQPILQTKNKLINESNRRIIIDCNLEKIEAWILDTIFDWTLYRHLDHGNINLIYNNLNNIIRLILNLPESRFAVNPYKIQNNRLEIGKDTPNGYKKLIPSIRHLSTGENILLILFTSILMDSELNSSTYSSFQDIEGIVIIDEIDLHLHPDLQGNILPKLIKLFPKIQFIITTHSPLFLLGMEKKFNSDFEILELPTGRKILAEEFNEFKTAYEFYENTKTFEIYIQQFKENKSPIIFVEDEFHQKVLAKLVQKLKINMSVQIVGSCSNVENICEYFKADDTKYFLTDGDNKGNKFEQIKNFIHLSKYCLENYFFNSEILQTVLNADKTFIEEKIFETVAKCNLANNTATCIDLAKNKEPALFRTIFNTFDCSKIIDDFLKNFNITKDNFICNYINATYKKDEYKKIFSEITDIINPSNVVDIKTKRKKH